MVIALIMETDFKRLKTSHVTWKWLHMEMIVMAVLLEFLFPFPNLTFFFFNLRFVKNGIIRVYVAGTQVRALAD